MGHNKTKKIVIIASIAITVSIVSAGIILAKLILSGDDNKRHRQVHMVTLLKPPPPPKIEEKPPEPEIKKEEIKTPEPEQDMTDQNQDDTPPGDQLGVDADGTAGSDAFGLMAKKGGRALIGSGDSRYQWYTRFVIAELQEALNKHLNQNGNLPKEAKKTLVRITLNDFGKVIAVTLLDSTGDKKVDDAVKKVLTVASISAPPPMGMPKTLNIKISPQG
jgi:protein TonB